MPRHVRSGRSTRRTPCRIAFAALVLAAPAVRADVPTPSRAVLFVPFGAGQAANHQPALAILFASLESLGLATLATAFPLFASNSPGSCSGGTLVRASCEPPLDAAYAAGYTLLFGGAVVGIVQANLAYHAPPAPQELPAVHISFAPTLGGRGASLGIAVRF